MWVPPRRLGERRGADGRDTAMSQWLPQRPEVTTVQMEAVDTALRREGVVPGALGVLPPMGTALRLFALLPPNSVFKSISLRSYHHALVKAKPICSPEHARRPPKG